MINLHSYYSLKYGILSPEQLVNWVEVAGYNQVVLTDINNTSAALSFIRLMQQKKRIPIVGIDFRNGVDCCYVGIAKNNEGFMELNQFLSHHLYTKQPFPKESPLFKQCYIIYPWEKAPENLRHHERIGIASHQLNRLKTHQPKSFNNYVVLEPMTFSSKRDFNTHRLLRAIDSNTLLSMLPIEQQTRQDEFFIDKKVLSERFEAFPELIFNTEQLLSNCSIHFQFGDDRIPQNLTTYTGSRKGDYNRINEICHTNRHKRYQNDNPIIHERIKRELNVIKDKAFLSCFLIAWDIVSYAQSKGYFYVGRGSGANSIISYLLTITDVDPLELDLYFERFINLYRKNPPDFDIDFSWRDRDDVIRYIFDRFPHVALICTYNTFQYKATIRELGKVFGLPKSDIDSLSHDNPTYHQSDEIGKLILKYSQLIAGFPSHLSVHAGGIIISEKPIHWYAATFPTSKDYLTTQFSMLEAEDIGFYKFDILSQRGLGKIKDCLDIIRVNQPENPPHDIRDVERFKKDLRINNLLRSAKALGCFYIESPGMRMLMTKLQTSSYLELVAASSIIRPGVAQSGMMREYILRHRIPERRNEADPTLLELMPETYGVMVYQEDVIKVANRFANLSLEEADVLRRAMSGKFRSRDEFKVVKEQFFKNCSEKGHTIELTQSVWSQIESFGGFAFSKGHSASYAVESYQSLYLKTYYPLEYMVATINNFGGFYRIEIYVHEAKKLGASIEAPCINHSHFETTINKTTIFIGFQHIQGLELLVIEQLMNERVLNGPFLSFDDLTNRVTISLEQLVLFIRVGALRSFSIPKKELVLKAHLFQKKPQKNASENTLFASERKQFTIPELQEDVYEDAFEQLELLGLSLYSPFELLNESLPHHQKSTDLINFIGKEVLTYGYHVTIKRTTTKNNQLMLFGSFIDIEGNELDTVHFPDIAMKFPIRGIGIYEIKGVVTTEYDFQTIEVSSIRKIHFRPDPRYYDGSN